MGRWWGGGGCLGVHNQAKHHSGFCMGKEREPGKEGGVWRDQRGEGGQRRFCLGTVQGKMHTTNTEEQDYLP